jgi:hypothetical protein
LGANRLPEFCAPRLRRDLNRVPRAAEWRGVAKIEIIEVLDQSFLKQRRSDNVDPLRDFRLAVADDLGAEQTA